MKPIEIVEAVSYGIIGCLIGTVIGAMIGLLFFNLIAG